MKDLKEVCQLALELVRQEGGQASRRQIVRIMIYRLGNDGNSTLAEEGIDKAISVGSLSQIGDILALV